MELKSKIYVAGHQGLVGSALLRRLQAGGFTNFTYRTREELDLRDQGAVAAFFQQERPEYVFLTAAKVGGIKANASKPGEFIYDNLMIQTHIIHQAYLHGVKKLLFLGSSCIYPKFSSQPMKEEYLLEGKLEPTNEPYAVAKIAGIKMCQAYNLQYGTCFISVVPANLYGPGDNFHPEDSHVIPALLQKFHLAKVEGAPEVVVWGTGSPRREFLYVDDMADACAYLMEHYNDSKIINIGGGQDLSIRELVETVAAIVGYRGRLVYDSSQPDGMPLKSLDNCHLAALGWQAQITLREGLQRTYDWFCQSPWIRR
ncbi:MAG: GDP-L-fucose synthase [Thermodesulfobacteriota bacterium]